VLENVEITQPAAAAREPAALRDQVRRIRQRQGSAQGHEPRADAPQLDAELVQRLDVCVVLDPRQQGLQPVGAGTEIRGDGATFALEDWVQHGPAGLRWGGDGSRTHISFVSPGATGPWPGAGPDSSGQSSG